LQPCQPLLSRYSKLVCSRIDLEILLGCDRGAVPTEYACCVIWFRRNRAPRRRSGPAATAIILRRRPVGGVLLLIGRSAKAQLVSRQDHAKTEKLERDPTRLDHRLNQMVLTHQTNRAGLRAFLPHLLYEADLGPDLRCSKASSRTLLRWKYTSRPSAVSINPYPRRPQISLHGHGFPLHCGLTWPRISRAAYLIWRCAAANASLIATMTCSCSGASP